MVPDPYSLAKAGLDDAQTRAVLACETQEQMCRLLRRYRCEQLEELHVRQQALDTLDYIICKIKNQNNNEGVKSA